MIIHSHIKQSTPVTILQEEVKEKEVVKKTQAPTNKKANKKKKAVTPVYSVVEKGEEKEDISLSEWHKEENIDE